MKRIYLLSLLLGIVFFAFTQKNQLPQQFIYKKQNNFDSERLKRLDSVFTKLVEKGEIPHAVTFVAHKGHVVHNKAYGWRNIEKQIPCTTSDYFRMASQTKAITVVGLLTLFEEGKFQLDEPVKKYIPEFTNPKVIESFNPVDSTYTSRPAKTDITIRHLLTHTAGISYGNYQTRKIFDKAGVPTSPMLSMGSISLAQAVKKLATCPLEHDPGEKFTYGMGVDVIGYLIEVISGQTIDKFLNERVFMPLGMQNTYFNIPTEKVTNLVQLYQKKMNKPLELNMNSNGLYQYYPYQGKGKLLSTGAGLSGTIEDYARFCQMILNKGEFNGKRILSRKTIEMMTKNNVGNLRGEIGFGLAFEDFRAQYSYRSMASEGSLRWGGMFGTDYIIDPKEELIILFYINLQPNNSDTDYKTLFHNLVYQALK
ncbi:MAG: beta-lactamase family protein [Paludibacter sp.]|nr:beta-lactamase family protein [Paludibacter sp.]